MKDQMQTFKQRCIEQYIKGQPIISDKEFDATFDDNPHHDQSATPPEGTASLPVWMGSLTKVRTNHQLVLWLNKYKGATLELTAKLDGVSGLLGPQATFLYQRGNGKVGQNISKVIPYLNLPKVPYMVRGEIIIPVETFDKHYRSYKNPRNLVAGLLHQKTPNPEDLQRLHFVAYEIIDLTDDLDFISQLKQDQFRTPLTLSKSESDPSFDDLFHTFDLASYDYETDGVVVRAKVPCPRVTSGNPKHVVALKLDNNSDTAITEVLSVSWNIGKWSSMFPVLHLKPVHLRGVTISNVTGNNAAFIREERIGPGTILKLKRSGGVIPKIVKVLEPSQHKFCGPDEPYEWEGVHIKRQSDDQMDLEVLQARLLTTLKGLEIKHLGPKGVAKLVTENSQVRSFLDVVRLVKEGNLAQGSTVMLKVQDQIQSLLFNQGVDPALLIGHMGAFGPNVSNRRLTSIIEVIPTFLRTKTIELDSLLKVKGFKKIAETIHEGYPKVYGLVQELSELGVKFLWVGAPATKPATTKGPLHMNIVYTGFRDLGVPNDIRAGTSVSSKTDLLVVKDLTSHSTKVACAQKLGIKIMSRDDFISEYQGQL